MKTSQGILKKDQQDSINLSATFQKFLTNSYYITNGFFRYNRPKYFNGTIDAFIKIRKVEGVTSLWSGLSPTLVLAVPTTVLYFTTYEQMKEAARKSMGLSKREANEMPALALTCADADCPSKKKYSAVWGPRASIIAVSYLQL